LEAWRLGSLEAGRLKNGLGLQAFQLPGFKLLKMLRPIIKNASFVANNNV
jgi:hypothetical protein